jgi:FMN phosphatase YigB (HAD superfamily)
MISGLLFDYGGTIDTNGLHWAYVLKKSYEKHQLAVPAELFNSAYSYGERSLAVKPLVKPQHIFLDVLKLKIQQQIEFLNEKGLKVDYSYVDLIAEDCNEFAFSNVRSAAAILAELSEVYPLVMVSNFYGNLNSVLENFEIRDLFSEVIESAVVGVRKPDAQIYRLGVQALGFESGNCMVIGDSFVKDIIPAKEIGCKAVWLRKEGWELDKEKEDQSSIQADFIIHDIKQLKKVIL